MRHSSTRQLALDLSALKILGLGALLAVLSGGEVVAQRPEPGARRAGAEAPAPAFLPFDPAIFERLLEAPEGEDQAALEGVEIEPREERRLGDAAADAFLKDLRAKGVRTATRGKDVQYLRKLIETLQPRLNNAERYRMVKLYLADSPRVDARSFPGGTIVVFRGLLDFAESEAALVGVLGHELSHFDRGHQLLPLKRIKLARQGIEGAAAADLKQMLALGGQMARLFGRPFRPEDEAQADDDGATWAYESGYDPREMARLFLRLHERDQTKKESDFLPAFLRTHPFSLDRHRAIITRYDELAREQPQAKLHIGRENLARRIPCGEQELDP